MHARADAPVAPRHSPNYDTGIDADTHVHPNWAVHPVTGDRYSPYNKPASIVHWLEHAKPTADYVIILDADMIIRHPMTAELVEVEVGRPVSAYYGYLIGVFKENYMKVKERVKNVEKAQQVGGFSVMALEDLKKVAPLWLKWTEEVRQDPESWGNTGDIYNSNGKAGPPWIAEMYGYVFACAEVGLNFKVSDKFMLYPGYAPPAPEPWPVVMHYGLTFYVGEYAFDKHWYMMTDLTTCPSSLFNRPPTIDELRAGGYTPTLDDGSAEERRVGAALTVAWGLYNATRAHAIRSCKIEQPADPEETRYRCSTNEANVVLCSKKARSEWNSPPPALLALPSPAPLLRGEKAPEVLPLTSPELAPLVGGIEAERAPEVALPPPPVTGAEPTETAPAPQAEESHADPALVAQKVAPQRKLVPHVNVRQLTPEEAEDEAGLAEAAGEGEQEPLPPPSPKKLGKAKKAPARRLGDGAGFAGDEDATLTRAGPARRLPWRLTGAALVVFALLLVRALGRRGGTTRRVPRGSHGGGGLVEPRKSAVQERKGV